MNDRPNLSTFIVNVESEASDGEVLEGLAKLGLRVDEEYGLIRLDPRGLQRVARVIATQEQLEQAQSSMRFTYYPDLTVLKPRR